MKPSEVIKKYGWIQGAMGNRDIGYCLMGAMYAAAKRNSDEFYRIFKKLNRKVAKAPLDWNDNPKRTKEEVINMLESIGQ